MTYISTLSMTSPLRSSVLQAQSALTQAQTEISTGAPADLGLTLGANTGTSLSLTSQIDELNGYTSSNATAATRLSTTANTLETLLTSAQSMSSSLISASTAGGDTSALQDSATSALQELISGLNTSVGNQSIFGGINTAQTPIADYFSSQTSAAKQDIDQAFSTTFSTSPTSSGASSIDGTDMQSFLDNQFAAQFSDSTWQSNWSSASDTTMQSAITPSQTVSTSVSANNTAFRQIAEGYTMLSEFSGSNLSDSAKAAVVSTASGLINSGIAALTNLQSTVGVSQSAVTDANSQISSQVSVLQSNASNLDSVDTYALSSQVTQLQTQLEASYELTARLQDLSLTTYLTATG